MQVARAVPGQAEGDEDGRGQEQRRRPARYGIRGIPALLIFKGGKVAEQIVGFVPKDTIDQALGREICG